MTATLDDVDWADLLDQPPLCTITEIRQCPHGGRGFKPCDRQADFQVFTRCEQGHERAQLVCFDHEELMRLQPAIVYCEASHSAVVVAVERLGGGL